jgi:cytochrome b6-f complex iron-sulfur subunit
MKIAVASQNKTALISPWTEIDPRTGETPWWV